MSAPRDALVAFAVRLAEPAGGETLRHFHRPLRIERKGDGSPVSEADRATERVLRERIEAEFPDDGILGEELGATRQGAGRVWVLDPIDGTQSFVRGVPLYAVLVALLEEGEPVLGVAHFPALGETLVAAVGLGTRVNGAPARVSETAKFSEATLLVTDEGAVIERLGADAWLALRREAGLVRSWGDAYGHFLVATGRAEGMLDCGLKPWDALPMIPLLREAGGAFVDWKGNAGPREGDALAVNSALRDEIVGRIANARFAP